uniref:Uncharacterized protein n=1 Tax=Romanomermis culicivorax TaxID=13658 RepID=A0A915JH16_ROMCU
MGVPTATIWVSKCPNDVPDSSVIEFVSEESDNQTVKLTDEQDSSSKVVELLRDGYSINSAEQVSTKPIDFSFDGFNDGGKQLEENPLTEPVEMMFDGFSNVVPSVSIQNVSKAHSAVPAPQTLDLFGISGSRPSQYLFQQANVQKPQNPTVLIATTPQSPLDVCRQVAPTCGLNNASFGGTSLSSGDLYAAFGANPTRQHVTAPLASALHNFNVGPAKGSVSSTQTATAATAFLLPENGLSLFTQPPPAIARGAPMQPPTHGLYTFPQAPINAPRT